MGDGRAEPAVPHLPADHAARHDGRGAPQKRRLQRGGSGWQAHDRRVKKSEDPQWPQDTTYVPTSPPAK